MDKCSVEGCDKEVKIRGLCHMHYTRLRRSGSTDLRRRRNGMTKDELCDWLIGRAVWSSGCLVLLGTALNRGYPRVRFEGESITVSRLLIERREGRELKRSEFVRHLCHNKLCILLDHLEVGSQTDNFMDNIRSGLRWGVAKLTPEEVREIRRMWGEGHTIIDIALENLHVNLRVLEDVIHRRTWDFIE